MKPATPNVDVKRVDLSIGSLDLFRFRGFDHDFPRHTHDHYTIGVFEKDGGVLRYGGRDCHVLQNDILLIPPAEVHAAWPDIRHGWTYRAIYPSAQLISAVTAGTEPVPGDRTCEPFVQDRRLAAALHAAFRRLDSQPGSLSTEQSLLLALRALLLPRRTQRLPLHPPRRRDAGGPSDAMAIARACIDSNFDRPVRLAQLASTCGLSPFHLLRTFRDTFGLPPHAYLTQVRVARARDMLNEGMDLTAVAYRCGFADQSHMTRVFRAIVGVTPGVYARRVRRID